MLTVEAVIILRNGPEQNETVASHYFMENRTKQLRHIIYGEQNETFASHYFMERSQFLLYYTYMTGMILLQILPCALNCSSC